MDLVVHIGAGNHPSRHTHILKKLLRKALSQKSLQDAASVIELSPLTNTGKGSNLDRQGSAVADSCLVLAEHGIADVLTLVAIDDDQEPTKAAFSALDWLNNEFSVNSPNHTLGLSKPSVLDYKVFREYVNGPIAQEDSLVSKQAKKDYDLFTEALAKGQISHHQTIQDTVGCIELSPQTFKIASSSGGNFYKIPGRISCAGVPGAATSYSHIDNVSVGCMCTGNGDDIIKMGLASYVSEGVAELISRSEDWPEIGPFLVDRILRRSRSVKLTAVNENLDPIVYVGVICVVQANNQKRLIHCHSTETFYFGFRSGNIETVLSRLDSPPGTFVHGEFKLESF